MALKALLWLLNALQRRCMLHQRFCSKQCFHVIISAGTRSTATSYAAGHHMRCDWSLSAGFHARHVMCACAQVDAGAKPLSGLSGLQGRHRRREGAKTPCLEHAAGLARCHGMCRRSTPNCRQSLTGTAQPILGQQWAGLPSLETAAAKYLIGVHAELHSHLRPWWGQCGPAQNGGRSRAASRQQGRWGRCAAPAGWAAPSASAGERTWPGSNSLLPGRGVSTCEETFWAL